MVLVTDVKRIKEDGSETTGFYMDGYKSQNLALLKKYLKGEWDCVGIVSGHGKVRIGKSTEAIQVGYYIAWCLSGGEMVFEEDSKGKTYIAEVIKPKIPVKFDLKENIVFSAEELQERAMQLYKKYGKNQVIVYDEGRQGLDSSRAMETINKGMQDFFQECGFMGHVILIVVPNFFKLHEDYAVARSLFLIDVFAKGGIKRGFFNFYNEYQKELLYFFGKKKLGVTAKYGSANPSFWGRFTKWLPFDKGEYEKLKKEAIEKKIKSRAEKRIKLQRDSLIWILNKKHDVPLDDIRMELNEISEVELSERHVKNIIGFVNEFRMRSKGY